MSILQYFNRCSKKEVALPELPDPSGNLSKDIPLSSIAAGKAEILDCHQDSKKKWQYIKLTPAQRSEIGRKVSEIGHKILQKKYPDLPLTEPTVRRTKRISTLTN